MADYYIDVLQKRLIAYSVMRYGADMKRRRARSRAQGPARRRGRGVGRRPASVDVPPVQVGPIVGSATWGGLVGILGYPDLMDGGVSGAQHRLLDPAEGVGRRERGRRARRRRRTAPADVIAGHDPQLERAIAIILEDLKKNPPKAPKRPPFPVKVVHPGGDGKEAAIDRKPPGRAYGIGWHPRWFAPADWRDGSLDLGADRLRHQGARRGIARRSAGSSPSPSCTFSGRCSTC